MNEILNILVPTLTGIAGSVAGWLSAKRRNDNSLFQEQSNTIRLLMESNRQIMTEYSEAQERVLNLTEENTTLKGTIKKMESEINSLRRKNENNNRRIEELQRKLEQLIQGDTTL